MEKEITSEDVSAHTGYVCIRPDISIQGDILFDKAYRVRVVSHNGNMNIIINKTKGEKDENKE
jgi:hypothetical protein